MEKKSSRARRQRWQSLHFETCFGLVVVSTLFYKNSGSRERTLSSTKVTSSKGSPADRMLSQDDSSKVGLDCLHLAGDAGLTEACQAEGA